MTPSDPKLACMELQIYELHDEATSKVVMIGSHISTIKIHEMQK